MDMIQPSGPSAIQVAAPLNDVQLVALVAAQRPDILPEEAVKWANEIVYQAIIQSKNLQRMIQSRVMPVG